APPWHHVMSRERGRPFNRTPEPLELPRVGGHLPQALHRNRILPFDRERQRLGVGPHILDRHDHPSGKSGSKSLSIRLKRARQSSSSCDSSSRARASCSGLPRTRRSRPCWCFVTRPASSSTATCFCTAANDMS